MRAIIKPGPIAGQVAIPPSKSLTQRAYAAALLHKGVTKITNAGWSEDEKAALEIIHQLGAEIIEQSHDHLIIRSSGTVKHTPALNCGESGLSARLFTPVAALSDKEITIRGEGSINKRSMNDFGTLLPGLGVELKNFNGYLPLSVKGPLQPKSLNVDGSPGSQFLSGLLFALSTAKTPVTINVSDLKSTPYIDLTLDVLAKIGKPVRHENYERFVIDPNLFTTEAEVNIHVESDWSSAAYWLVGATMNGTIGIKSLDISSRQADKQLLNVLQDVGAGTDTNNGTLLVSKQALRAFTFDATNSPDLFPILAVLAGRCESTSVIKGLHRLANKESNRADSTTQMLRQLGIQFEVKGDSLYITGQENFNEATIDGHNDHRIVMAGCIAALCARGPVTITDAQAVSKSYPEFFDHLSALGIECHLIS